MRSSTTENQRLAVQELVWTAQAAIQQTLPVRFEVAGGVDQAVRVDLDGPAFTRPPSDRLYEDVAPIWVTSPGRDQVLPATKPVVVQGLAIVFEANVNWQLERGPPRSSTGHATASIGAPMQGEYSFDLGKLTAGDYTIQRPRAQRQGRLRECGEDGVLLREVGRVSASGRPR